MRQQVELVPHAPNIHKVLTQQLFKSEWTTNVDEAMGGSGGALSFEAFYGTYSVELRHGSRLCTADIELQPAPLNLHPNYYGTHSRAPTQD